MSEKTDNPYYSDLNDAINTNKALLAQNKADKERIARLEAQVEALQEATNEWREWATGVTDLRGPEQRLLGALLEDTLA